MRHIVIREMRVEDIPAVVEIENLSFSIPWSSRSFMSEIYKPYSIARVAIIGDRVVGYICAERIIDEAHILNLAVHPDFRRMGIGRFLVSRVLEELRKTGCRYIYLEVRVSNIAARRLYERFRFKVVGIRKGYYALPEEDAYVMMLELEK